jgi:hypothetical protein
MNGKSLAPPPMLARVALPRHASAPAGYNSLIKTTLAKDTQNRSRVNTIFSLPLSDKKLPEITVKNAHFALLACTGGELLARRTLCASFCFRRMKR